MKDNPAESDISSELIEEELKMLVQFIERHHRWAKTNGNTGVARLNEVAAESLVEAAELIRTLCAKVSAGDSG